MNKNMNIEDICCCCLVNCCFKNINRVYNHNGKLESYAEMLSNTFNVSLRRSAICARCIVKLKDAAAFKQQILAADLLLITQSQQLADDDDDRDVRQVKLEPEETNEAVPQEEISEVKLEPEETNKALSQDKLQNDAKRKIKENKVNKGKKTKRQIKEKPQKVLKGPLKNTVQLISNSNLCIFKPFQNNTVYACYICKENCTNIKELREHSKTHEHSEFLTRISVLRGLTCRHVDISNLSCICAHACEDLDALTTHLTEKHDIQFQNGGHLLIPYKLENGYQCVICKNEFNTFYSLKTHMNCHSTHNVCDICGNAYFSRQYLLQHVKVKHRESTCRICLSKFPTVSVLAEHTRKVHKKIPKREYQCKICNLIFNYRYKLKNHMDLSHGMPGIKVDCNICGKLLKNKLHLKTHTRNVHDKERRFQCTLCDLRFFTKFDRDRHEKTHLDQCLFTCDCCETKFKSKDSMRRHMKKQHSINLRYLILKK